MSARFVLVAATLAQLFAAADAKKSEMHADITKAFKTAGAGKASVAAASLRTESTTWVNMMAYSGTTCSGTLVSAGNIQVGVCNNGAMITCASGVPTYSQYANTACTGTAAGSMVIPTVCQTGTDSMVEGETYNGAQSSAQFSCGSSSTTSVSGEAEMTSTYTAAGCASSTMIGTSGALTNQCFGYTDGTYAQGQMTDTSAGTWNSYDNAACTGTPTTVPYALFMDVCAIQSNDDDGTSTNYQETTIGTSSAARIMGNLPVITVMVAGLAGLLSMM